MGPPLECGMSLPAAEEVGKRLVQRAQGLLQRHAADPGEPGIAGIFLDHRQRFGGIQVVHPKPIALSGPAAHVEEAVVHETHTLERFDQHLLLFGGGIEPVLEGFLNHCINMAPIHFSRNTAPYVSGMHVEVLRRKG